MLESFLFAESNHINNLNKKRVLKTAPKTNTVKKCDAKCDARVQKSAPRNTLMGFNF